MSPTIPMGEELIRRRKEAGLSQRQAARALSISRYKLSQYETDRSQPKRLELGRMLHVYGVTPARLRREMDEQLAMQRMLLVEFQRDFLEFLAFLTKPQEAA